MPSNQSSLGALPSRFRRERVLIVGCGDIGLRVVHALKARVRVLALTSTPSRVARLREAGLTPLLGNLDSAATLHRLAGLATRVLHLAPPPSHGPSDSRSHALIDSLRRRSSPRSAVYGSTSGVYGNCDGEWVEETRPACADTPRAKRRLDAEARMRCWGRGSGVRVSILRVPGIYASNREGGTPQSRLIKQVPVLRAEDDVYTNHIHADDLARACCLALWRGAPQRTYNINDDSMLRMGDYFDVAADIYGLARPPRITREQATQQLPPTLLSFMAESRRMVNQRMKRELRLRLRHPTVHSGLLPPH